MDEHFDSRPLVSRDKKRRVNEPKSNAEIFLTLDCANSHHKKAVAEFYKGKAAQDDVNFFPKQPCQNLPNLTNKTCTSDDNSVL